MTLSILFVERLPRFPTEVGPRTEKPMTTLEVESSDSPTKSERGIMEPVARTTTIMRLTFIRKGCRYFYLYGGDFVACSSSNKVVVGKTSQEEQSTSCDVWGLLGLAKDRDGGRRGKFNFNLWKGVGL